LMILISNLHSREPTPLSPLSPPSAIAPPARGPIRHLQYSDNYRSPLPREIPQTPYEATTT
jgi:hypothetical protein